jgi:ribosomal protein L36
VRDYIVHRGGRLVVVAASRPRFAARKVKRGEGVVLDAFLELVVPVSRVAIEPRRNELPPVLQDRLPLEEW